MTATDRADHGAAVVATDLTKIYRLGELHSLQNTINRILGRSSVAASPPLKALDRVSFSVGRGAAFGMVGTNGSGKSTVLQLLAGTTLPTGGSMTVAGRVIPLLAVGTGFHPELTGTENVMLFASSLGVPRAEISERLDAVEAFAQLERHMSTPLKRFSSGMIARLCFAVAMQFPADIYVFDEVLAVVDGEFQAKCLVEISRLNRAGRTVIFVSHDLDQVATVCDHVMWLEKGRVERVGPAAEVLDAYRSTHGDQAR